MHERSLAEALIRQIDEELHRRRLHRLAEVRLAIGEFAGVEPRLLASEFDELAIKRWSEAPRLRCELVPLTACCQSCAQEFVVSRFRFECPRCGAREVNVRSGEGLELISLSAEPIPELTEAAP